MAGFEKAEELIVGLDRRGEGLPKEKRLLNMTTSKILKNGWWSPWLVNLRPALSLDARSDMPRSEQGHVKGLLLDALSGTVDKLEEDRPADHVYGPPENGTPLAAAVSGRDGRSLLWRRVIEKPGYGAHQMLEGAYYEGEDVTQIDDVMTSGLTKEEEAAFLGSLGLGSNRVAVGVDRQQGGMEAMEAKGWKVGAALQASEIFDALHANGRLSQEEYDYLVAYTALDQYPTEDPHDYPWAA